LALYMYVQLVRTMRAAFQTVFDLDWELAQCS